METAANGLAHISDFLASSRYILVDLGDGKGTPRTLLLILDKRKPGFKKMMLDVEKENRLCVNILFTDL